MQKRSIETQKPTWGEMRGTAEIFTFVWFVTLPGRSDEYPTEASNLGYSAFFLYLCSANDVTFSHSDLLYRCNRFSKQKSNNKNKVKV